MKQDTENDSYKEKQTGLGLKMGQDLPEIITPEGVHVYNGDPEWAKQLGAIVNEFPQLWIDKGIIKQPEEDMMRIELLDGWQKQKVASRMYPLSRKDEEVVDKIFNELHRIDRMEWVHRPTPFGAPVFVVWRTVKGVAKGRVVIDMRALNKVVVPDNYPLPLQETMINCLRGKKFITAIDASSFFYQFGVYPPHRDRFTIITPRGLERSKVALMGFRNSPAHTQRFMDRLFDKCKHFCRGYIDDIVIFSDTAEDHIKHLRTMFSLFMKKNITISPAKSFLGYPDVELLGFHVNGFGRTTTASRVAAFKQLEFPRQLKALEQYIGATGFLRHLIPYYAKLIEPLQTRKTALLAIGRKDGKVVNGKPSQRAAYCRSTFYEPVTEETKSFEAVQEMICNENPTILSHFDPDKTLYLNVDGCLERGFGVMVFHTKDGFVWDGNSPIPSAECLPVLFLSRCLTKEELNYGPTEQEVACLVWAVKNIHTMIHGSNREVIALTDHSATVDIMRNTSLRTSSTDRANRRLISASVYLSQFNIKGVHFPGRLNFVPDALSRLKAKGDPLEPHEGDVVLDNVWFSSAQIDPELRQKYIEGYDDDPKYARIIEELRKSPTEDSGTFCRIGHPFTVINRLLYNIRSDGTRSLCIPRNQVKDILDAVHDKKHHFGRDRMMYDLRGLTINNKTQKVKKYIEFCPSCGPNQTDRQTPIGNYQPIRPSDTLPMRVIAIDFIVGLPEVSAKGSRWQYKEHTVFNSLMTVSDKATKRTMLIPGNDKYTAEDWGELFLQQLLIYDWGVPHGIISDRDSKFVSEFWKGMWTGLGTKLLMTAAYHPQANGMDERKNQSIEIAIRFHTFDNPDSNWVELLPSLQWNLNSSYSDPLKSSPHEQLFGFKLPGPLDVLAGNDGVQPAELPTLREHLRADAQLAMDFASANAKHVYDGNHRPIEFKPGDMVYLRLGKGYHLPGKPSRKFSQQHEWDNWPTNLTFQRLSEYIQ